MTINNKMILENSKHYKNHLNLFYKIFEEENHLGLADKFFLKKFFDNSVWADAKLRMYEGDENWAHNVSSGYIAWQTYFEERKNKEVQDFLSHQNE